MPKPSSARSRASKAEKLRLDRNVEPGNDLIGDQNFWNVAQRARDVDALALPA